jgi:TldD protein
LSATQDNLQLASRTILVPGGLDEQRLDRMLGLVMDHAIDSADLYFQVSREESWALEDGIVKEGSASIEEGVGVRAISGEKTGFAYSDEIQPAALEEAARAARAIAKRSPGKGVQAWHRSETSMLYQPVDPLARPGSNAWTARPAPWIRASSR